VRLLELVGTDGDRANTAFHSELTVLGNLDGRARRRFVDDLDRAAAAVGKGTELHYRDQLGRHLVVTRVGGRRRVLAVNTTPGSFQRIPLPPSDDIPRTTRIDARTLSAGAADLTLPQRLDLLVSWLNRARHQGPGGHATVAVLDEPLSGLSGAAVRTMLEAIARLARTVQIIYLTADPAVVEWASRRAAHGALSYVTGDRIAT
jgi:hypothetical protein